MTPFTIKTFFPSGDPSGFRISEITNDSLQAFYIPKEDVKKIVESRLELTWNGVYTLFSNPSNGNNAYIGEAENVGNRLKQHLKEDTWEIAIIFIINNREHQLSKADIKHLEHLMYTEANKINNMNLINANTPHNSFVSESRVYDLKHIFKNIDILLRSFGYPLFYEKKTLSQSKPVAEENLFHITFRDSDAWASYNFETSETKVLAGSKLTPQDGTVSFQPKLFNKLTKKGIIKNNIFKKDYTFSSSSTAAKTILKRSASGPSSWKNKEGKSIKDLAK